jgi:hypothetical protein
VYEMKTLLLCVSFMLASSALATTTNCQSGSMGSYLASSFACQSGSLIFSDFDYRGTGADANASSISVITLAAPDNEGFQFAGGWSVQSQNGVSNSEDSQITYTVQHPGGLIDSLSLSFGSFVTGTGAASVTEHFCLGASIGNCPQVSEGSVAVTNPGSGFSDRAFFAGVENVGVSNIINVTSGVNGTASISNVGNRFSSPEPLSFVLLGTGLLGIGLMRRRLDRRR